MAIFTPQYDWKAPASWARLAAAIVVAAALAFSIHVFYGQGWAACYVDHAFESGRLRGVLHQPYPAWLVTGAFLMELLPIAGKVVLYSMLRDLLPGRSRLAKGTAYGVLLMAIGDTLIRQPLMDALIGNPLDVVLIQNAAGWAVNLCVGITIALLVPARRETKKATT
jgi:hypothetical protein